MKVKYAALFACAASFAALGLVAATEPWFGAKIPASGEDGREDCGMSAAKVFDSPIPGLRRIGTLAIPKSSDVSASSSASIGFEGLYRLAWADVRRRT